MDYLQSLNQQQFNAVTHDVGPVFVVAGAGSGKTRTLTMRIAYLIEQGHDPERILAVTFTNKAAREMKERVVNLVGPSGIGVWMYTFHAFGLQILRRHISLLPYGYRPTFSVIDEDDGKKIIKECIKALNLDSKDYSVKTLKGLISRYKTQRLEAFEFNEEEMIYLEYQRRLRDEQLLDFDDLILYTQELLKTNQELREYYQMYFEHILVDEFQDTDVIQYDILHMLGIKHKHVFVVGDPDQSIYAFRGSFYGNNLKFIQDFKANKVVLDQNYRSTNKILEAANRLINHNKNRPATKNLISELGPGQEVIYFNAPNDYRETFYVINEISRLQSEGYPLHEIAVLYRNNALSRIFEDALIKQGIPYIIYGGLSFYERKEIKDALAYVRVVLDPIQSFYLKRIVNTPRRGIGNVSIQKLEAFARQEGLSLYDAIDDAPITGKSKQALLDFKTTIQAMQTKIDEAKRLDEVLSIILDVSGYVNMLKEDQDEASDDRILNLRELVSVFKRSETFYEGSLYQKLSQLLDQIALYTDLDKSQNQEDAVVLSTVHQVKGLEFSAVFMVVMEESIFPSDFSTMMPNEIEEERRVCYVGMTRAKRRLYMSSSRQRMVYGQMKMNFTSRFIKETKRTRLDTPDEEMSSSYLSKGDKVIHNIFGEGVVVSMDEDIATIAFPMPHGIKKILESHPGLKKKGFKN
ncbi:MAG: ATP-dependent helicase [Acholeplasmataceae bacterium]